jgi:aminopeptidase-like protein
MTWDPEVAGHRMYELITELYPVCRSITGNGVRETLRRIGRRIPLTVHEVPSGTRVLDWTVPDEWNIRDAYIKNAAGERIVDFQASNLHVVSYSTPVQGVMTRDELRPHLHTLPEHPDWIPYRTSYYERSWGFCLTHRQLEALQEGDYEVVIDATLGPGHLTYGECVLPGATDDEVLISCHICHPSLCNDNLSGIAVAVALAGELSVVPRRYTYRFVFIPGTIGAITWLARNEEVVSRIRHGIVLTGLGDAGYCRYKRSRRSVALVDRAFAHVLRHAGKEYGILDFEPYGYDERQYCSPGFDLPVGRFMRTPNGQYPEYHTSADDLRFVRPASLSDSVGTCLKVVEILECDARYVNLLPKGEPQLGRRGLYRGLRGSATLPGYEMALLWVLNLSDGRHTLLDIAERSQIPFGTVRQAADDLAEHDLLVRADAETAAVRE